MKNKLNKVTINVKDKNYEDLLSSYKALSQNKRIYDNIMNNYKGIMITQYSNTIGKLNPIIKIHENNIQQNIKIFPSITKSIEHNNKSDYFDYDELQFIESLNENSGTEIKKHLNEKLFDKSLLFKRNRLIYFF